VLATVLVVLVAFAARLVYVQAVAGSALAADAYELQTQAIPAERGQILDTNGVILATSVERYDIVADQVAVARWGHGSDSPAEAAALLAPLLGIPAPELGARLAGERPYVYLARGVAPEVHREVMALEISGIRGELTTERLYPAGTTAGNVVGFVGAEGHGMAGLEQTYDEVLAGVPGSDSYEAGARGQRIPSGVEEVVPAQPGSSIQLTIAEDLQYQVQTVVDAQRAATGAEWVVAEVRDVRTGEILALADSGSIDPNNPDSAAASRAAAFTYEPGSTAKVITMAAVLERGVATPTSQFVVPDTYTTANGQTFSDSHEHPDLRLTLNGILAQSSNAGTVMVGEALPRQVRYDYLADFGFGSRTGIGLPGETAGLLHPVEDWDGRSEHAVLFGQSVGVTTLQTTGVYAALANGGLLAPPHLVAGTRDPDGTFHPTELAEPRRVVSAETADTLVRMLESAVTEGTGGAAAVPGYRIAGKTGTAQAFEGDGVVKVVASFIGIAPADDPRIVVNVVLYNPRTSIYGGTVAAPVFSEVAGYALHYLGVPPSGTQADPYPTTF
jgi:cell division protein FtsI (penicillin-binding protein 3)